MKIVLLTIALIISITGCNSGTVKQPEKQINKTEQGETKMKQKISALTEAEQLWIKKQIQNATEFVRSQIDEDPGPLPSLDQLDRAYAKWVETNEKDADKVNHVINCVGIAYGQHLVNKTKLYWVIASDEYGTELAVFGFLGKGDFLIYPQNFIAKRFPDKKVNFMVPAFEGMIDYIEDMLKQWEVKENLIDDNI